MSNTLAIVLAVIIIAGLVLDQTLNAGTATLFLLRKLADLLEYVSFWR